MTTSPSSPPPPPNFGGNHAARANSAPLGVRPSASQTNLKIATWQHRLAAWALNYVLFFLTLGIGWMIWSLVVWSKGQNPGRQILKIQSFSEDTRRPASWGHTAIYEFLFLLAIGMICGFINLFTFGILGSLLYLAFWLTDFFIDVFNHRDRRSLRDKFCRILVVNISK
jgi:hypothetical protein